MARGGHVVVAAAEARVDLEEVVCARARIDLDVEVGEAGVAHRFEEAARIFHDARVLAADDRHGVSDAHGLLVLEQRLPERREAHAARAVAVGGEDAHLGVVAGEVDGVLHVVRERAWVRYTHGVAQRVEAVLEHEAVEQLLGDVGDDVPGAFELRAVFHDEAHVPVAACEQDEFDRRVGCGRLRVRWGGWRCRMGFVGVCRLCAASVLALDVFERAEEDLLAVHVGDDEIVEDARIGAEVASALAHDEGFDTVRFVKRAGEAVCGDVSAEYDGPKPVILEVHGAVLSGRGRADAGDAPVASCRRSGAARRVADPGRVTCRGSGLRDVPQAGSHGVLRARTCALRCGFGPRGASHSGLPTALRGDLRHARRLVARNGSQRIRCPDTCEYDKLYQGHIRKVTYCMLIHCL